MSISMEPFAASGLFLRLNPDQVRCRGGAIYQLQCRQCGHEHGEIAAAPGVCPKCGGHTWERFVLPGSILENAQRQP